MILTPLGKSQAEARDRALKHPGFGLFSEMRVGKTLTALSIIDARKPDIFVIVCPKKAIRVWREQIKKHVHFDWRCTKFIVHFESISRNKKDRARWRRQYRKWEAEGKTVFTVVDEAHRIKRRGSQQSRTLRGTISDLSTWRLALTGTPIAQGREDAWAIFDFIMPGALEETWDEFEEEYLEIGREKGKGGHTYPKIIGYLNTEKFDEIFHKYSSRRTLREAQREAGGRPYRVRKRVVEFDLKPESLRIYNELLRDLTTVVRRKKVSTPLLMTLIFKLQQVSGGYLIHTEPLRDEEGYPLLTKRGKPKIRKSIIPIGREKIVELVKLIQSYPEKKKLVICVQYTHEINRIARRLERLGRTYKVLAGGIPFDGKFDVDTVLLQIRSGEAVDLSEADTYIFYSWNHSFINFEQSRFRILKFSSRLVNYVFLMARNTVDRDIYDAVVKKKNLAELVCDRYRKRSRVR